jgi:hypothetical protein
MFGFFIILATIIVTLSWIVVLGGGSLTLFWGIISLISHAFLLSLVFGTWS